MFSPQKKPTRIGQWNGRRRSSRSEEPLLSQLNRTGTLLRLGCVLATALGATLLAFVWGTPQPHRVGEICPHDLSARVAFDDRQRGQDRAGPERGGGRHPAGRAHRGARRLPCARP